MRKGQNYDEQLGDVALKKVGKKAWNKRVRKAIAALDAVFEFDHLYIGGGNSRKLTGPLGERVSSHRHQCRTARWNPPVGSGSPARPASSERRRDLVTRLTR